MRRGTRVTLLVLAAMTSASPAGAATLRRTDDFVALDAATGSTRWRATPTQSGGGFGIVAATRSTVFTAQWRCQWIDEGLTPKRATALVALDAKTGRERWRVAGIDNGWSGDAASVPDWVFDAPSGAVPVYDRKRDELRALDPATGTTMWTHKVGGLKSVAGNSRRVVLVAQSVPPGIPGPTTTRVVLLDRGSGTRIWSVMLPAAPTGTAVVLADGDVAVPVIDGDGSVVVWILAASDGTSRRELPISPAVNGGIPKIRAIGTTLVVSGGGTAAVDAVTGTTLWSVPGTAWALPASRSTTYVYPSGLPQTRIDALDTTTGAVKWSGGQNTMLYAADAHQSVFVAANLWHASGPASVVDTNTGSTLWSSQFSDDQHLIVTHGSLYVSGGCPPTIAD